MAFITRSLILIGVSLLLSACNSDNNDKRNSYVHLALSSPARSLDPAVVEDQSSRAILAQVYEMLFQYAYLKRPLQLEPLLAQEMPQISKDRLQYVIKIKPGVFFQDDPCFKSTGGKGREVLADDFVYSFKRIADPKNHSDEQWIKNIRGVPEWGERAAKNEKFNDDEKIEGLQAVDRYTLKISLLKPHPQLLSALATANTAVVPREAVEFYGVDFGSHAVGTGPYILKQWVRHSQAVLERNPTYRVEKYPSEGEPQDSADGLLTDAAAKLPLNDGIIFTDGSENSSNFLSFRKGNLDWTDLTKENFDSALKDGQISPAFQALGINFQKYAAPIDSLIIFNMEDPVWGQKKSLVRKAIAHALDVNEMIAKFRRGAATVAHGPIMRGVSGFDETYKDPNQAYDLKLAKDLLKKAGYPAGQGLPELNYDFSASTERRQAAEYFQNQMAKIGIRVSLISNGFAGFVDKVKTGKFQALQMGRAGTVSDGQDYIECLYGKNIRPGTNWANYVNSQFDRLFLKAAILDDGPKRTLLYRQMNDIVNEDVPEIYIYDLTAYVLSQGWLKNFKLNAIIANAAKYYKIDLDLKRQLKRKL